MTKKVKIARWLMLITGLLIIALGVFMLFTPVANLFTLAMLIGIAALFLGITEITTYFNEDKSQRSGMTLLGGIVVTILGIQLTFRLGAVTLAIMLPLLFGILIIVYGAMRVTGSLAKRRAGTENWMMSLLLGVLKIALGVLLLFFPVMSALIISTTLSVILVIHGLNSVFLFFGNHKLNNRLIDHRAKITGRVFMRGAANHEN